MHKLIQHFLCKFKKHTRKNKLSYSVLNTKGSQDFSLSLVCCNYCNGKFCSVQTQTFHVCCIRNRNEEKRMGLANKDLSDYEWFLALFEEFSKTDFIKECKRR